MIEAVIIFGILIWAMGARHIHRRRKQGRIPFKDYRR